MNTRIVGWSLLLIVAGIVPPGRAQVRRGSPPYEGHFKVGGLYFDNFFQTSPGGPKENVWAAQLEGRVGKRLRGASPLAVYVEADYVRYDAFDPSHGITLGLQREARPHGFHVSAQYLAGRPSRETRDILDRTRILGLDGEYSYRVSDDVEVLGLGDYRHESFELAADEALDVYNLGGAVRYRGFGRRFSPEVGVRLGARRATNPNEDLSQRELSVRVRSAATRDLYLTFRFRHRRRPYSVDDPGASNFERLDRRRQWTATADWKRPRLTWNLYYALEDSASTRPTGVFRTQLLVLGVTFPF